MSEPGFFEILYSLRAMRRLKPDPVPDDLIWRVLEAATQAPSGGNSQPWAFVVVRDPARKAFIQERYKRAWDIYLHANLEAAAKAPPLAPADAEKRLRMVQSATNLAEHLHEAPVLLLICMLPRDLVLLKDAEGRPRSPAALYASIFPAAQNVLLACRALGLGATLTTLHLMHEAEIKQELGIPPEVEAVALIPIGYPVGRFGPVTRAPVQQVTYWDSWGIQRARP
jgi:nitroreductase